jgi:hypothetical protein
MDMHFPEAMMLSRKLFPRSGKSNPYFMVRLSVEILFWLTFSEVGTKIAMS